MFGLRSFLIFELTGYSDVDFINYFDSRKFISRFIFILDEEIIS